MALLGCGLLAEDTVGPDGGTIRTPNGDATLEFPAGALSDTIEVSIFTHHGAVPAAAIGNAYRIEPVGLALAQAATLELSLPEGTSPGLVTIGRLEGNEFFPLATTAAGDGAQAAIDRLGVYVAVAGTDADGDGVPAPRDCDDTDDTVSPDETEIPGDGLDNDCDGRVDESCNVDEEWAPNGYPTICPENENYSAGASTGQAGQLMPGFELVDQHGEVVDFRQFLGFVTLLDIAAEWCLPCRQTASQSQALSDDMQSLGPAFLISVIAQDAEGAPADPDTAERWADDFQLEHPVLADENEAYSSRFGVFGFPTFFLLRPDGTIDLRFEGAPPASLIDDIDALMTTYADDLRYIEGFPFH